MKTLLGRWLMLLATLLCLHAQASPILYLQPARQIADPNQPVVMDLLIRDLDYPATTLGGFDVELSYDPAFLDLMSIDFGLGLGPQWARFEQVTEGVGTVRMFTVSLLDVPELIGLQDEAFRLATLSFDWVHPGPGTTRIEFASAALSDSFGMDLPIGGLIGAQVEIPEPGALALVALGLLAMFATTRRTARAAVTRTHCKLLALLAALLAAGSATAQPVRTGMHQPFLLVATGESTLDVRFIASDGSLEAAVKVGNVPGNVTLAEMAIADFDGDGALDFVAGTNENPGKLYLFRRTGARTFARPALIDTLDEDPRAAYYLARGRPELAPDYGMGLLAADVDGDGDVDILEAVNHAFTPELWWITHGNSWLNDGTGRFRKEAHSFDFTSIAGSWATGMSTTLGDLNGDRYPDIVVTRLDGSSGPAELHVLYGQSSGKFKEPATLVHSNHTPAFISVGSLDNDGIVDVLAGMDDDTDPGQVYAFLASADRVFDAPPIEAFDTRPAIESGTDMEGAGRFQLYDITGDGVLDAVASPGLTGPVGDVLTRGHLEYYKGLGGGRFGPATSLETETLSNLGFTAPYQSMVPPWPAFILAPTASGSLDAYFTQDGTRLSAPAAVAAPLDGIPWGETAVADFDGDGRDDFIAATNESLPRMYLFRRTGPLEFAAPTFIGTQSMDPKADFQIAGGRRELAPDYGLGLITADLDNDGDIDLLEARNQELRPELFWIARGNAWLNDGHGGFTQVPDAFDFSGIFTGWTLSMSTVLGDLNGDGYPDMLASEQQSGDDQPSIVYALYGNGDGTFGAATHVFTAPHPATYISMGDVNNNGTTDALVGMDDDGDPGQVYVFFGRGNGTFEESYGEAFDAAPDVEFGSDERGSGKFQLFDATRDGILDVVASPSPNRLDSWQAGRLQIFRGLGNGRYQLLAQASPDIFINTGFSAPHAPPAPVHMPYDFNGDGNVDLSDLAYLTGPAQEAMRPYDPLDVNEDGVVNVADARYLALHCTLPRCGRVPPPPAP